MGSVQYRCGPHIAIWLPATKITMAVILKLCPKDMINFILKK